MLRWLRKRMRKFLWVVAVAIAASFGVTYTMRTVIESTLKKRKYVYIFGEKMSNDEVAYERHMLRIERSISGRPTAFEPKEMWEEIALLKEAERLGLMVPRSAIEEQVLEWYKWRKLDEKMWRMSRNKTHEEYRKNWENFYRRPQIEQLEEFRRIKEGFTEVDFARLLEKNYENIFPREFREATARMLLKNMLMETVYENTDVDLSTLYEEFLKKYHRRRFQILYIRASDFRDSVMPSEEALLNLYERLKNEYRDPERYSFDYVMLNFAELEKSIPDPDEKTLKKYYDRIKWQPPIRLPTDKRRPDAKPFKPFKEVKDYVIKKWKEKESREKCLDEMNELLKRLKKKPQKEIDKILKEEGYVLKRTKPAAEEEFVEKNRGFGRTPVEISKVYTEIRRQEKEKLKETFNGPIRCEKGYFIWRLADVVPSKPKSFEEIRDKIEERYRTKESERVAERVAKGIALEMRARGDVMREIALKRHLIMIETDFVSSPENRGKIEGIKNAARILRAGFTTEGEDALKEVGDVAGPIRIQHKGDWYYYIIRYAARKDPEPEEFTSGYYSLRASAIARKWETTKKEWKEELLKRANITTEDGRSVFEKPIKPSEPKEEDMFPKEKEEL